MHSLFSHLDTYPNGYGDSKAEVLRYIKYRAEKYITQAVKLENAGIQVDIILANEPTFVDQNGKFRWQGDGNRNYPPYSAFGKDWITEAYVVLYQTAIEKGLTPGKDFKIIGINERGIELGGTRTEAVVTIVEQTKQALGNRLNIPWEQIPFDLGVEFHTGETYKDRDVTVPFDQIDYKKIVETLRLTQRRTKSSISITELDGYGNDKKIAEAYYTILRAAIDSGVVGDVNYWRALASANEAPQWRSGLFDIPAFSRTQQYYYATKALLDSFLASSKQ
jgi:hypothetical protein